MLVVAPDAVHVWLVRAAVAPDVEALLDDAERDRADRFKFDVTRRLFVAAHGALRLLLGRYLERPPESLRFETEPDGKPTVDGPVQFNLSHSDELAAIAVAGPDRAVGVDVDRRRMPKSRDGIAQRIMTADELACYESLGDEQRGAFVLWVWARKEALVKASGRGVRETLTALACEPTADSPWSVVDLDVPGYAAAVAAAGHDWTAELRAFHG
ncbi:MAG: 4'-phosphopantetheinyl transferase superfamily protein [Actinobacteria bacterium]|nr:4'-phosphopantetheinyl transferase superfamily protein [Actinomycetota bacterium]